MSNKGWLRTMFYSLTQQIVRQDLGYWIVYAALRPDRNHRLVAYPYYAKYALPGDKTTFRHIDLNVNKYLESSRGGEIIQGSVSFDDEDEKGCTELVLGFHKQIGRWWSGVRERDDAVDGWVTGLNKRYTAKDEEEFGPFVSIPCARGDARVTKPEVPHGSTGPQARVRRTVLPWFVGLQPDMERLDNDESDTWSELAAHNLMLTAPKYTPSGLENRYGPPPFKFPPSTHLILQSRVSSALVCRVPWTDHMVEREAKLLLGEGRQLAWRMVLRGRMDALRQFKSLWPGVKEMEIQAYGSQSFFGAVKMSIRARSKRAPGGVSS